MLFSGFPDNACKVDTRKKIQEMWLYFYPRVIMNDNNTLPSYKHAHNQIRYYYTVLTWDFVLFIVEFLRLSEF